MILKSSRIFKYKSVALTVLALLGFQVSASAGTGHDGYTVAPMPEPGTLAYQIAHNYADAWNSHDPDFVVTFFTEDVFYGDITGYPSITNREELRAFAAQVFTNIPDIRIDIVGAAADGSFGFIEWIFSGTNPGTGKHFAVQGVAPVEIRGDLISRLIDYWDRASF